ncbi:MAG TPA: hypothetical protein VFV81_10175, partial [Verrucomicrobiae bacterium]|nr:hypothetical protein [Verrucomicrobiae bacterium]
MAFVFWLMMQIAPFLRGQSVLNVTDYGAVGDAVQFSVSTVAGSPVVTANGTNTFTSADIGKVIEVFRAGPQVYYNGNLIVTQQDIICTVQDVSSDGTSLTLSIPCGYTLPNAYCIVGTDNVNAFQNVINLASGMVNSSTTNVTIEIPSGTYLLINAEALDTNFVMSSISETEPALTISSGGLTLQGEPGTVLMGCGAGMNHYVNPANMYPPGAAPIVPYRGNLFFVAAPSANPKYPLVFNNLVLDGGLLNGLQ